MKKVITLISMIAFMLPSFAFAEDLAKLAPTPFTDQEQEEILKIFDDTVSKQKENIEYFQEITKEIDLKKYQKTAKFWFLLCLYLIPVTISDKYYEDLYPIWSDADYSYQDIRYRLERYENAGYEFANNPTRIKLTKTHNKWKRYIKDLTRFFLDDPGTALYFIEEEGDRKDFLAIAAQDDSVLKLLKNFNKVISEFIAKKNEGKEAFEYNTLKKLASVSTEKFYERLAEYVDVRSGLKQAIDKSFKTTQTERKVDRVIKKEDERREKVEIANRGNERLEKETNNK